MAEKIYYPEEIASSPLPEIVEPVTNGNDSSPKDVTTPETTPQTILKPGVIATQLLNNTFDSVKQKIMAPYGFGEVGAFKVGKYKNGVSGEVTMSPSGILARNSNGDYTFVLDGDTGDATFRGIVQASGFNIIDESGIVSLNSFYTDSASAGAFNTASASFVDVTSGALSSLVLPRDTNCFIYIASLGYNSRLSHADAGFGRLAVYDSFISTQLANFALPFCGIESTFFHGDGTIDAIVILGQSVFVGRLFKLSAGTHNLKLQMQSDVGTSYISGFELGLIKFGN